MTSLTRNHFLTVRLTGEQHKQFCEKAQKIGKPSEVLREIVDAFVENRIQIKPPVTRKLGELYVN